MRRICTASAGVGGGAGGDDAEEGSDVVHGRGSLINCRRS